MSSIVGEALPAYADLAVTREEYLDLAEDGFKYDVVGGVMRVSPSASSDHGNRQLRFAHLLQGYLDAHPMGRAFVEVDVLLPDGGDPLRPDVSFVRRERLHIIKQHIHGAPDLACEVLSDATAPRDLGVKADRYLTCGVAEYWIVDPRDRSMQLWLNRGGSWDKRASVEIASELCPGLQISADRLFEE